MSTDLHTVPTPEQQGVLEEESHCVTTARPGSGKTFTMARKIQSILPTARPYQGVIAISFTNKASDELRTRALVRGIPRQESFFGTIDSFTISEIIKPFGRHLFGRPKAALEVKKIVDVDKNEQDSLATIDFDRNDNVAQVLPVLGAYYVAGVVLLEAAGWLSNYIVANSRACRRYVRSRYTHVFVDEYQDCGVWQHRLFLKLVALGLVANAVGDLDQSIYAFAKKFPQYLQALLKDNRFAVHALSQNRRCHRSIDAYAMRLRSAKYDPGSLPERRVFQTQITGDESAIASWIDRTLPSLMSLFGVQQRREAAILVRGARTSTILDASLVTPHRVSASTPLDEDSHPWAQIFRGLLFWVFCIDTTKHELVGEYLDMDSDATVARRVLKKLQRLKVAIVDDPSSIASQADLIVDIARTLRPGDASDQVVNRLRALLVRDEAVRSFSRQILRSSRS